MLNCQNERQRQYIYELLCILQPVNPRWIAVLREEHKAVRENDVIAERYWGMAGKVLKWWKDHYEVEEDDDDSDSDDSDQDTPHSDTEESKESDSDSDNNTSSSLNVSTATQRGSIRDHELELQNFTPCHLKPHQIINAKSFKNAHEWFIDQRTNKDVIDQCDTNAWEKRDWKILGASLVHMQIGSWSPCRSFNQQFRLRVDLERKALCYHLFSFKARDWKGLGEDMQQSLLGGNQKTQCLFFVNELERFVTQSRHAMMYIPLENVVGLSAHSTKVEKLQESCPQVVVLDLKEPPRFFEESPLDFTGQWRETKDFTPNQEASRRSRHFLILNQPECDKIVALIVALAGKDSDVHRSFFGTPQEDAEDFEGKTAGNSKPALARMSPLEFHKNPET